MSDRYLSRTAAPVQHGDERKLERNLGKLVGDFLVYAELDYASEAIAIFIDALQRLDDMAREKEEMKQSKRSNVRLASILEDEGLKIAKTVKGR